MATEVGVGFVRLLPSMRGFSAAVSKELGGQLGRPMDDAGQQSGKRFSNGFAAGLASGGTKVSGFGDKLSVGLTVPLAAAAKKSSDLASALNEQISAADVVFERNASVIQAWSKTTADGFGVARADALAAATGFFNFTANAGVAADEATGMSTSLVELAADLASFHDEDPTDMLERLQSGLAGEVEPLRRFGIDLSAASVKAKALELGLADANGEISRASKVQATYALLLQQSSRQQGDFARTSEDVANKQRRVEAQATDAAAAFGTALLPAKIKVLDAATRLIEGFNGLSTSQQDTAVKAGLVVAAIGPAASIMGRLATGVSGVIKAGRGFLAFGRGVATLGAHAGRGVAAFARLSVAAGRAGLAVAKAGIKMTVAAAKATARVVASIATQIARWVVLGVQALLHAAKVALAWIISLGPIGLVIAAVIGLVALVIANWDTIVRVTQRAFGFVTEAIGSAIDWVKQNWPLLLTILTGPIGLAVLAIRAHWDTITAAVGSVIGWIRDNWKTLLAILTGPIGLAVLAISRHWDTINAGIAAMKNWIRAQVDGIVSFFVALPARIRGPVAAGWAFIRTGISAAKTWVAARVNDIVATFRRLPGRIGSALARVAATITAPFRRAFNGIRNLWNRTVGGFSVDIPGAFGFDGVSFSIPKMHTGGTFEAPPGQSEGLALLEDGEQVFTPEQLRALTSTRAAGSPGAGAGQPVVVQISGDGLDEDLKRWLRRSVRVEGGGDVQVAFGA